MAFLRVPWSGPEINHCELVLIGEVWCICHQHLAIFLKKPYKILTEPVIILKGYSKCPDKFVLLLIYVAGPERPTPIYIYRLHIKLIHGHVFHFKDFNGPGLGGLNWHWKGEEEPGPRVCWSPYLYAHCSFRHNICLYISILLFIPLFGLHRANYINRS